MLILVTNDDGIHSPGLEVLAHSLKSKGRVVIVAPDRNRSAVGHALTLERPLRAEQLRPDVYSVDGTPTDCVHLGIHGLIQEQPDLVVSGINRGSNIGDDITYSGTVSAALEASLMGIPSFAMSYDSLLPHPDGLELAGQFATKMADIVLDKGLPAGTFLNVNVPHRVCNGVKLTKQGKRRYSEKVVTNKDPRGRAYYWITGTEITVSDSPDTDSYALQRGFISVSPLRTNLTHEQSYEDLHGWLDSFSKVF